MSFKREGDDPSQLNVLKKRRVADLLANYIPEDEAFLLRDGRYSCTVCSHRPVFDTLEMLTVHRSGKKHLASLQKFYGKKQLVKNETQKRQHQAYVQAEEAGTQMAPGPAPLLVQTRKIAQNALLKSAPYNSCCRRNRDSRSDVGPSTSKISDGSKCAQQERHSEPTEPTQTVLEPEAMPATHLPGSATTKTGLLAKPTPKKETHPKRKASLAKQTPSSVTDLTPEKRQALEHYLKLKSSGWIRDSSGKWVKDENVEFDSDEEVPPAVTPS